MPRASSNQRRNSAPVATRRHGRQEPDERHQGVGERQRRRRERLGTAGDEQAVAPQLGERGDPGEHRGGHGEAAEEPGGAPQDGLRLAGRRGRERALVAARLGRGHPGPEAPARDGGVARRARVRTARHAGLAGPQRVGRQRHPPDAGEDAAAVHAVAGRARAGRARGVRRRLGPPTPRAGHRRLPTTQTTRAGPGPSVVIGRPSASQASMPPVTLTASWPRWSEEHRDLRRPSADLAHHGQRARRGPRRAAPVNCDIGRCTASGAWPATHSSSSRTSSSVAPAGISAGADRGQAGVAHRAIPSRTAGSPPPRGGDGLRTREPSLVVDRVRTRPRPSSTGPPSRRTCASLHRLARADVGADDPEEERQRDRHDARVAAAGRTRSRRPRRRSTSGSPTPPARR